MNRVNKNLISFQVQNEYKVMDDTWLKRHYRTMLVLIVLSFFIEIAITIVLFKSNSIQIGLEKYVYKYIFAPASANLLLIIIASFVMHSKGTSLRVKVYFISLLSVFACFVAYTAHGIFESLYVIFFVPILFTVIYSDFTLTTVTAFTSIASRLISDLLIVWDPDKANPLDGSMRLVDFIISTIALILLYFVSIVIIRFQKEKNEAIIKKEIAHHETQQRLIVDELTNVYNRIALRNAFQSVIDDASDNSYTFAMIDLDNFKWFNDTYGHQYGDQCLYTFGSILKENCPHGAIPFRYGGDEFCILFKNIDLEKIVEICKKVQSEIKEQFIDTAKEKALTASIGIAKHKRGMSPSQLFRKTDMALYRSKNWKDSIYIFDENFEE